MATAKTNGFKNLDPKIKWLGGLVIVTAALFIFLKSPAAENAGVNVAGMESDASYSKTEFYGGPETSSCTETACPDSRIKITAPTSESRLVPRKTHKISWTEAESIESRYHTISVHAIGCGSNCPAPYVIVNKSKGNGFYNWQIGSFLPVPQHFQNVPVWLRVTATGRYDSNGNPTDFYAQVPVVFSATR